jgi:hypothetical protein
MEYEESLESVVYNTINEAKIDRDIIYFETLNGGLKFYPSLRSGSGTKEIVGINVNDIRVSSFRKRAIGYYKEFDEPIPFEGGPEQRGTAQKKQEVVDEMKEILLKASDAFDKTFQNELNKRGYKKEGR